MIRFAMLATAATLVVTLLVASAAPAQQITVGAGSSLSLSNAGVDLGCSDLVVAGTLNGDSAAVVQSEDVNIASGGTLNGGSGSLDVTGNWSNAGTFNAGTGSVAFVDGCATTSSTITGASTFNNLSLTTTSGKQVNLEHGVTQTVAGTFGADGSPGNLLVLRSTLGGSTAFVDAQGAAGGDYVDVDDVDTGAGDIILGLNSVVGGNAAGWSLFTIPVPAVPLLGLVALGASLLAAERRVRRS